MTKEETARVVAMVLAAYPMHFKAMNEKSTQRMIEVWYSVLGFHDVQTVGNGLRIFIASDSKGFPPSPGQVNECIQGYLIREEQELQALEAWQLVSKAARDAAYHAKERFAELPETVQKAVGSPEQLKEWASMSEDTFRSVEQSHFIRVYNTILQRKRDLARIPQDIRQQLPAESQPLIEDRQGGLRIDEDEPDVMRYKRKLQEEGRWVDCPGTFGSDVLSAAE